MRVIIFVLLTVFIASVSLAQVRSFSPRPDEILNIKTAMGIATIIQVPETIQSAIIGDQSGFKVEYLDKAVTIKPLRWAAKTNLYLVTEKNRYNLRLITLNQENSDFIVYIKRPSIKESVQWRQFDRVVRDKTSTLKISRIGLSNQGFILIHCTLTSNRGLSLKPSEVSVIQGSSSKVIDGLFISQNHSAKLQPILIGVSLAKSDLEPKKPLTLEVKGKSQLSLTIPGDILWK